MIGRMGRRSRVAVVLTALGALGALGSAGCSGSATSADGGSTTAPRAVPVVHRGDAVKPVAGRDYTLVRTLRGAQAENASQVADTGEIHVTGRPSFLLDPVTNRRTPLPSGSWFVQATRARAIVTDFDRRTDVTTVRILDRRTDRVRVSRIPAVDGRGLVPVGVAGGRIWWSRSVNAEAFDADYFSTAIGSSGAARSEGRLSALAVDGDTVVTVRPRSARIVRFRDLHTGRTAEVSLPKGCSPQVATSRPILTNGTQATVNAYCRTRPATSFLLDAGGLLADLRVESDEGVVGLSDRMVSFYDYAYDIARQRLLKVSDRDLLAYPEPSHGPGAHPIGLWPRGAYHADHVDESWVVRLK